MTGRVGRRALAGLAAYGLIRWLADTDDLTSSGTTASALRLAVPILLAALGGLYAERAGVVNIGLEGMMVLGTWFAAWGSLHHGVVAGVALGMLGGAVGAVAHALATVWFRADQIISGVAVNLAAAGTVRLLSSLAFEEAPGGGITQSPRVPGGVGHLTAPFLAGGEVFGRGTPDLLGQVEDSDVFPFSGVAGLVRGLTRNVSWLAVAAVLLVPLTAWVLHRTRFGLRLRAVGEQPAAARSVGVAVLRIRTAAVLASGALAGLGGSFLVLEGAGHYREGQTAGRGFIGLAAVVFGHWRPAGVAAGAGLFGWADAVSLRGDARALRGLLLVAALGFFLAGGRALRHRRPVSGLTGVVAGCALVIWFAAAGTVPQQLVSVTPHMATLVVLTVAVRPSARAPAAWTPL